MMHASMSGAHPAVMLASMAAYAVIGLTWWVVSLIVRRRPERAADTVAAGPPLLKVCRHCVGPAGGPCGVAAALAAAPPAQPNVRSRR